MVLEHDFVAAAGLGLSCRAEAEKRISRDPIGIRQETGRCSAMLKGRFGSFEAAAGVDMNDPGGIDLSLSGAFQHSGGSPRLCLEARLERLAAGCPALTALAALRLERRDGTLSLESGIEGCAISTETIDAVKNYRLKVSWSTRCTLGK
jgi:hypothetical protein